MAFQDVEFHGMCKARAPHLDPSNIPCQIYIPYPSQFTTGGLRIGFYRSELSGGVGQVPSQSASSAKPQNKGKDYPIGLMAGTIICGVTLCVLGVAVIRLTAPRRLTRDVVHTMICTFSATTMVFVSVLYFVADIMRMANDFYLVLLGIIVSAIIFISGSVIVAKLRCYGSNSEN